MNRALLAVTANDLQRLATRLQGEVAATQTQDPNRMRVELARRAVLGAALVVSDLVTDPWPPGHRSQTWD